MLTDIPTQTQGLEFRTPASRQAERDELEALIKVWLAEGNQIQVIPAGICKGNPLPAVFRSQGKRRAKKQSASTWGAMGSLGLNKRGETKEKQRTEKAKKPARAATLADRPTL